VLLQPPKRLSRRKPQPLRSDRFDIGWFDRLLEQTWEEEKDGKVILKLKVGNHDVGKIIGKKERTAYGIRTLLGAVAAKEGKRAILEIAD